jgi:hypothetical protein
MRYVSRGLLGGLIGSVLLYFIGTLSSTVFEELGHVSLRYTQNAGESIFVRIFEVLPSLLYGISTILKFSFHGAAFLAMVGVVWLAYHGTM